MKKWVGILVIAAAGIFLAVKIKNRFVMAELPLAETSFLRADGSRLNTTSLAGKYLIVSCFQSWCGDCIREAPSIAKLQEFAGKEKLEVLMVSDEEWAKINRFAALLKCDLPMYQSGKSFDELGIRIYPSTWLLNPEGKILLAKLEGFNWNSDEVRRMIQ
jgi:cytochrome c biogenesis protein CcmG/thiol:disulfide interchange protein DsbE